MGDVARIACNEVCGWVIAEAWRTGFAAGCAAVFGLVVVVQVVMRLFSRWEALAEREKKEREKK